MPDPIVSPVNPVAPVTPTESVPAAPSVYPAGGVVTPPKKKIPKALIFILLGLILFVGVFLIFRGAKKTPTQSGEITWWGLWEDESTITPLITEYQTKNPKVKIKYVKQSQQDYRERLTNALAKGVGPDIFMFHNSWVPMFKNDLDKLPSAVMTAAEFAQTFYPVASVDLTTAAGIAGIPLGYDAITLFINTDIFTAAGKNPPATWDDLRALAIEFTKKDDQGVISQAGVALGKTTNVDHWQEILALMMLQNGVNLSKPVGALANDAITFYTLFSTNDGVWDATLPPSTAMFAGGKLAMYIAPSWRAFEISQKNPALKFKTVPIPQLPKSTSTQNDVTYATYWVNGVWTKGKNKTAAWDFLKFLSTKDALSKMYANASRQRMFGQAYPRVDMADLLTTHPILGSIISKAPNAQSWYLDSRTFDGPTGINSLLSKYFEDAVNSVNSGTTADKALQITASGVTQVLRQYGVTK